MKLSGKTKSLISAFVIILSLIACNDEDITSQQKYRVGKGEVSEITSYSTKLKCKISEKYYNSISYCGFQYTIAFPEEDSLTFTDPNNWINGIYSSHATYNPEDSTMNADLTDLPENTLIFFRPFTYSNDKYSYGDVSCFRTLIQTLSVTTLKASNISQARAHLHGKLDIGRFEYYHVFGFFLSDNKKDLEVHNTNNQYLWCEEEDNGNFHYVVDELNHNTTYYYQTFFSYNDENGNSHIIYGEIESFTTSKYEINTITGNYEITGLLEVVIRGDVSSSIKDFGSTFFVISTEKSSFSDNDIRNCTDVTFFHNADYSPQLSMPYYTSVACLKPNTTYYYAFCFQYNQECYFGETKTFTTSQLNLTCTDASRITAHSILLSGNYNNVSTYCYELGFYISETNNEPTNEDHDSKCMSQIEEEIQQMDFKSTASGLKPNTTYYYRPYIYNYVGTFYGETKTFTTTDTISVDGTVDLGLSVLWAIDNLGATENNLTGNYYAWGETSPKNTFFINGYTIPNIDNIANTQYDVATTTFGNGWRMPTKQEICELTEHCNMTVAIKNGTKGIKMTSLLTGQSVFFPYTSIKVDDMEESNFSVYFWTSNKYGNGQAISAEINDDLYLVYQAPYVETFAHYGLPIRPVYDPTIK